MTQEYELKVGVYSDERLQVADLLKYLEAETNESITALIKRLTLGAKPTEKFTSTFERIPNGEIEEQ
ncbi:MAG: hypothetical protein JST59_02995 [Actinobacteria bacterium]|nr:hypothetical protein [Actinomycetota bacterium]